MFSFYKGFFGRKCLLRLILKNYGLNGFIFQMRILSTKEECICPATFFRSRNVPVKLRYFEIEKNAFPNGSRTLSFKGKNYCSRVRILRFDEIPPIVSIGVTEHLPLSIQSRQIAIDSNLTSK